MVGLPHWRQGFLHPVLVASACHLVLWATDAGQAEQDSLVLSLLECLEVVGGPSQRSDPQDPLSPVGASTGTPLALPAWQPWCGASLLLGRVLGVQIGVYPGLAARTWGPDSGTRGGPQTLEGVPPACLARSGPSCWAQSPLCSLFCGRNSGLRAEYPQRWGWGVQNGGW